MIGQVAALRDQADHDRRAARRGQRRRAACLLALAPPAERAAGRRAPAVRSTSPSSAWPGSSPAPHDVDAFWANIVAGVDAITEVPGRALGRRPLLRPRRPRPTAPADKTPSQVGRLPARRRLRPAGLRHPAALAGRDRARCSCSSLEVAAAAPWPTPATPTASSTASGPSVVFGAEAGTDLASAYGFRAMLPQYLGDAPRRAGRPPARRSPRTRSPACWPTSSPAASPTGSTSAASTTPSTPPAPLARRARRGLQGAHDRHSDLVLCGGADLHNGINDYLLFAGVHALSPTGPVPDASTPTPTASPSARASAASCSSAWPTPSATATASTR